MKQLSLKQIGSFVKTHGVLGQLALNLADNIHFDLIDKGIVEEESVFVELDGIPVPFFIEVNGVRNLGQSIILLKLEDVDDKKAASFIGCKVFIETSTLDDVGQYDIETIEDLIGYAIFNSDSYLGKFVELIKMKSNPLLKVDVNGKELLIPAVSDFIIEIDDEKAEIHMQLPDGYIDALLQD